MRNLFRYKKRVFVTIIGIAGSTSLILVGFGLKDSISNIIDYTYNNVFVYDTMITLKSNSDSDKVIQELENNKKITNLVLVSYETITLYNTEKTSVDVNLITPNDKDELSNVIKLNDINKKKKEIDLKDNEVVLSEKLARKLNVEENDLVIFSVANESIEIKVGNIVENYINDYCYMSKKTYETIFGEFKINTILMKTTANYDSKYNNEIIALDDVSNVVNINTTSEMMESVLSSLNSVVVILIISSATLAFVILYNLSTINISERKREISTLKVLGFYDEEVDSYITRENYFITIVGIIIGLIFGLYLSHYIISTCEPDYLMFIRHIEISSYIISALISLGFTIIVSRITHYNLKKIDMIESLKSNE